MAHLYPLRIDASTTKKNKDDDDNKHKSIRLIETLLLDPTCLPRPPSDYATAEEAVEANVKTLSDGLLSDFEVRALQPAGYRSGYYTGRMALLGLEELRGEVERQIRCAIWKLVDTGTGSVKASTAARGKRKSTSEGDAADTGGQKRNKVEERNKNDFGAKEEGSVEGEAAAAAPAAESSSSAAPSGFQPEMTGEEQAKVSNDDQREQVARSASSSPAPKEEKEAEEEEQEKKEKGGESIKSDNNRTEQGDDDSIDKSGLVKVHIRLRDRNLAVMDEFYIDPNLSSDLPGADVLSVSKSLVKDLNLPEEMTLGIMTTILEQSRGLEVPADLVGAKPSGGSKTGPSRETPAAWTLD